MRKPIPEHPDLGHGTAGLLKQEDIDEFRRLVKEYCGIELTNEEAWSRAIELVSLYRMMLRPLPEDPAAPGNPQHGTPKGP